MKTRFDTWLRAIGLIVFALVAAAAIASAIRTASWTPVVSVAWLPAVLVAAYSRPRGRCWRRRGKTGLAE
jgi:hypothetical protein